MRWDTDTVQLDPAQSHLAEQLQLVGVGGTLLVDVPQQSHPLVVPVGLRLWATGGGGEQIFLRFVKKKVARDSLNASIKRTQQNKKRSIGHTHGMEDAIETMGDGEHGRPKNSKPTAPIRCLWQTVRGNSRSGIV